MSTPEVLRFADWTTPVAPAAREVVSRLPEDDHGHPPLLFVPAPGRAASVFAEHWLGHAAGRGFSGYALSARPGGDLRALVHDTVQTAASLPRRTVLIGHGEGALVVAKALGRYPARAAVLAAPRLTPRFAVFAKPSLPRPAGRTPVLVVGSPDDRLVKPAALDRAAAVYGGAPLLFPGMGHDLMLEDGWAEPIDAILDWLLKELPVPGH
ncbi:alpha/beta hydrolase [Actinoplanes sp. NPDC023714]|uniref:alpha/beta hydrolase n=1 Tax=Actinoplanes sp. NPDC023714 TaxID=3154322 RepID=UPI0033FAD2F3